MKRASKDVFKIRRMATLFKRAQVDKHTVEMAKLDNRYVAPKKAGRNVETAEV